MAKFIERFIKQHITGNDPDAIRDFVTSDSDKPVDSLSGEVPDIAVVEPLDDPSQIKPMLENEAQGMFIGFITGIVATVLQRMVKQSEETHEKED